MKHGSPRITIYIPCGIKQPIDDWSEPPGVVEMNFLRGDQ